MIEMTNGVDRKWVSEDDILVYSYMGWWEVE